MIRSSFLAVPDGGQYPEDPPDGPPTDVSEYTYESGGTNVGIQWTNADADAGTAIGSSANAFTEPTSVLDFASPGTTSYETGELASGSERYWVRHSRGGVNTIWVLAVQ